MSVGGLADETETVRGCDGNAVAAEPGIEVSTRDPDRSAGPAAEPVVRQFAGPDFSADRSRGAMYFPGNLFETEQWR